MAARRSEAQRRAADARLCPVSDCREGSARLSKLDYVDWIYLSWGAAQCRVAILRGCGMKTIDLNEFGNRVLTTRTAKVVLL